PDAARRLYEHGVTRADQVRHQCGRFTGIRDAVHLAVEGGGRLRGELAHRDEQVDVALGRVPPHVGVELGSLWTELEHVAQHGDATPTCGGGEVVQGGPHRHRVGVVAVVDDDHVVGERQ